ncbi:MAG: hypothetical protein COV55_01540 [Candidatus Komeilibacteria bacterium CG11_big_fil_rev_8_21_14_0_20_36_20]|uniref:DUF721 domain-containing protein n=1 Tax=Candidatus Komeilibacteria bacterium CG11_big_fil_rev_8_21_14_0_20_36_20 TaxID=1974477 RepID=A0A2H0NDW6_9BACT|nr:MAG: hypothetical protein COV55_01540 [Candidatus Komeilibacteria bacterium CG11_big_fil_rev_8_21_14_0_20_36_20]PIR81225.1 MAG: hypothetical protein COU21_04525 [Candidatus Komeilibacteria bacterium CG10_big_fil_rev_8_21_14_0_10_36_65]PJC55189.1 MAG: hypothetical protein CO027_03465 [Candidatus Komeilibacteria bacterium CG_4_9_14_0_2_um_filter_36_13]
MSWQSIKDLANQRLNKKGVYQQAHDFLVVEKANQLIIEFWGEEVRNKVQALYFRNQMLTFAVLEDDWLEKLKNNQTDFINRLNGSLEVKVVESLRFLI